MAFIEQLEATTQKYHDKELKDATANKNLFFSKLFAKSKTFADGRAYTWPVKYDRMDTQWLAEYEKQNTSPKEQITQAEMPYVFSSTPCVLSDQELRKNSGKERILNLLSQKLTMLGDDVADGMATMLISGDGVKEPLGLESWVPEDPTSGTVAGINRATYDWWRSHYDNHNAELAAGLPDVEIFKLNCVHGNEKPDLMLTDATTYSYLYANAAAYQREPHSDTAKLGFVSFTFDGIPVTWSDELTATDQRLYFLRLADWELNFMKGSKMHRTKWAKVNEQRAIACYMYNDLTFLCKNPRNQGVMFHITGA